MKLKDLIPKLAALNPEAEVYVYVGLSPGPMPLGNICAGRYSGREGVDVSRDENFNDVLATPSDTLIVLSE